MVLRFFYIAFVLIGAVLGYAFRRLGRLGAGRDEIERLRGQCLARALQRLGATFIKFGQILSTRPDLLGPGIIDSLAVLQDQVPPASFEEVSRVLEAEWSEELRARVKVDPDPVAAASVAQVHRGMLDGEIDLAIKVQRRSAPTQVERDLVLMAIFAGLLDRIPTVRLLALPGSVERFGAAMRDQLDFSIEAANNRRFAENFKDVEGVEVPAIYDSFCTDRVLAMEFIDGVRATEPEKVGGDRVALARRGLEAILRMIFHDGFVHADLHPGNIFLTEDGTVVLIDVGLVAEIPDDLLGPWIQSFSALAQQDGKAAARLFYSYAPHVGTKDYAQYEQDVVAYFQGLAGIKLADVESSAVIGGMMNILRRHRIQINPVFTVVNIAILVAEGLGKQLDPSLDLLTFAMPHLMEAQMRAPESRPPNREPPTVSEGEMVSV